MKMIVTSMAGVLLLTAAASAQEVRAGSFPQQTGEEIFKGICQGCHMPDAKGATGAGTYPALASNPHLAVAGYPVSVVLHGQKAMPWFSGSFSDEQVANVVNYVRSHFGNHYTDMVTAADVKKQR
jgi:mono/diheme cytochrome c family protein